MPRKTLNILSLDLDWFNWLNAEELGVRAKRQHILDFFAHLRLRCQLPETVALMTEHHYLYPWCVELLKVKEAAKVNVYNIDEHHDFYYLEDIEDFSTDLVSCANFFAFMAHHDMIEKYHWISTDQTNDDIAWHRKELRKEFRDSYSRNVRALLKRHTVNRCSSVWRILDRKKFDGFAIVQSLDYTDDQELVYTTVDSILKRYFMYHGCRVGRNVCRSNYRPKERPKLDVSNLLVSA